MQETPTQPLSLIGAGFIAFAVILVVVPLLLVAKKTKPWSAVAGLFVAGWGFLLIGAGTWLAPQGWGGLVVPGVIVTTVGHLMQRRVGRP